MARRKSSEQTIFFPWERGGGFWRGRGVARAKPFAVALGMATVLLLFGARERHELGIRATRATLGVAHKAVHAYRADNEGKCPESLAQLQADGYLRSEPVDAWGNPLRLFCPGRRDPASFELVSDGPDGIIGGLDRIE